MAPRTTKKSEREEALESAKREQERIMRKNEAITAAWEKHYEAYMKRNAEMLSMGQEPPEPGSREWEYWKDPNYLKALKDASK